MPTNRIKTLHFVIIPLVLLVLFLSISNFIQATTPRYVGGDTIEEKVDELNIELQTRRQEIEELKSKSEQYRREINSKRNEAYSLQTQISILDAQIAKLKIEIKAKEQEIEITRIDIQETQTSIEAFKKDIDHQKEKIAQILRTIYQNDRRTYLEMLLLNDSLSDFFNEAKFIEDLHNGLHRHLIELKTSKEKLDSKLLSLEEQKKVLEKQRGEMEIQHDKLKEQEYVKAELLDQTQSSEKRFQLLLADLKDEQENINAEIVSLEKTLRAKLEEQEQAKKFNENKSTGFVWPVPENTITAFFHDPSYPYRHVFEHPAIDIRASQGTEVIASVSGYVAKTRKDPKCTGLYSYTMIIHSNGLSTVYGHMSQINVDEGDFVQQGQRIGLSGGMPGTCGSGRLTTGPHMHFEVRKNGIPVDPLSYLK